MKIMIFTEGTILMHTDAKNEARGNIVKQVIKKVQSVKDYKNYIPVGNAVNKTNKWVAQGAEILYLTSRKNQKEIEDIQKVLDKHGFPSGELLFRNKREKNYKDVAENALPNVLIEDDCESIGGTKEMTYTHISDSVKHKIKLIAVKEFGGIDHLPDSLMSL
jgi:hypothetical protein